MRLPRALDLGHSRGLRGLATAPSPSVRALLASPSPPPSAPVTVTGWLRAVREQKTTCFGELHDGSSAAGLQLVWPSSLAPPPAARARRPTPGSCVRASGRLVASPKPGQLLELQVDDLEVLGGCDAAHYPLQPRQGTRGGAASAVFLRDTLHLRARGASAAAALRARDSLAWALKGSLRREGVLQVHTPVLTSNDCEGAGELFAVLPAAALAAASAPAAPVAPFAFPSFPAAAPAPASSPAHAPAPAPPFFGKPVFLTVSGQLHLEAVALGLSRAYTLGPTFRAEDSHTPRHLCEFWMLEAELAPAAAADAQALCERSVRAACAGLLEERPDDVALLQRAAAGGAPAAEAALRRRVEAVARPFARLSYSEAVRELRRAAAAAPASAPPLFRAGPPAWGAGLSLEHERFIAERLCGGAPVFVSDYPAVVKPFYMRGNDDVGGGDAGAEGPTVQAFDLLVPGLGELAGGSAREERFEILLPRMRALGLLSPAYLAALAAAADAQASPPADCDGRFLDWYLDLRKFGGAPHAGFGLGFERLLMFATGIDNVRDAIAMPRVPGSCRM